MSTGTGRIYRRTAYVKADGKTRCSKSDPGARKKTFGVWWIEYHFRGERYRESSGSTRKKDAQALLRKRTAEMATGGPMADEEDVTFSDLKSFHITDLKANNRTLSWAKTSWKHLADSFSGMRAIHITTDRIREHITFRQDEDAAQSSIRKELAALRRAFNLAMQSNRLSKKPHFPTVQVDNAREGFFEPAELEKMLAELPDHLRPLTRFAALTGWRKGECLSLTWANVDFDGGEVRIYTSKNKEGRSFPFGPFPQLRKVLEEQRARTKAMEKAEGRIIPHVFHRNGKPIRDFNGAWRAARKRAKLGDVYFHDLRRTAVRNMERAGVPRSVAMKLTGHKTEAVYRRYAIADAAALAEGVEKLAKLHQRTGTDGGPSVVPISDGR